MRDSFKLEDNHEKLKKENRNLSIFFIFLGISFFSLLLYFFIQYTNTRGNYISKKDRSKVYIYTVKKEKNPYQKDTYSEIPMINLAGEKFEIINQAIMNTYQTISKKSDYDYSYDFNQSKNILALKITYAYYPEKDSLYPIRYFETFNIDLKTGEILTNEEILKKYHLTGERVNKFLEIKFEMFYNDLIQLGYYTEQECNYKCFLKNRGISDQYLNDSSYYIENNSLTLFKFYYTNSDYKEEKYFKDKTYQFIVKE